jgi:radical SAM superfamily enzyme YgiQ (UPF0313 family)
MMSDHHAKAFLGFGTTTPAFVLPEAAYRFMFYPTMKCDEKGHPLMAPYGLRKIEASLMDAGFDAEMIHPSYLKQYMPGEAKVLLVSGHDYLGLNPPSTTFAGIMKKDPLNRVNFMRMMRLPEVQEAHKNGMKIIAGGPSAWQLGPSTREKIKWIDDFIKEIGGIDCLVEGEADVYVREIVKKALAGEKLPEHVVLTPKEAPTVEQMCVMRGASVNGLTEIGRGCPRGCSFCSVTQRPMRWYPLEKIEAEIKVNVKNGITSGLLHSDDVYFYGSTNITPREDKLIPLMQMGKKHYKHLGWSHVAVASLMTVPKLLPKLSEIIVDDHQSWWGVEIGMETGSPRLITEAMPGKVAPFKASQWPELVVQCAGMLNDNKVYPACTFIVGLPQETEDDIIQTLDMFDDLWDFKAILVPMFFVPLGRLTEREWYGRKMVTERQKELMCLALAHGVRQSHALLDAFFEEKKGFTNMAYKAAFARFIDFVAFIGKSKGLIPEHKKGDKKSEESPPSPPPEKKKNAPVPTTSGR